MTSAVQRSRARSEHARLDGTLRQAAFQVMQSYGPLVAELGLEPADVMLLMSVGNATWHIERLRTAIEPAGADPQRLIDRGVAAGWIEIDREGRVIATRSAKRVVARLAAIVERLNHHWRAQLAAAFTPAELHQFLTMLHASPAAANGHSRVTAPAGESTRGGLP